MKHGDVLGRTFSSLYNYHFSSVVDFTSRSILVPLDTGTPSTCREDADEETRTRNPSALAIELNSSKASMGKELSFSRWYIA